MTRVKRLQKELDALALTYQTEEPTSNIRSSWRAFKDFAEQMPDAERAGLHVSFIHFSGKNEVLYAEFWVPVANKKQTGAVVGFLWSCDSAPRLLDINERIIYQPDQEKSLEDFRRQVEAMPAFQAALSLDEWKPERIN